MSRSATTSGVPFSDFPGELHPFLVSPKSRYDVVLNSYFMSALIGQGGGSGRSGPTGMTLTQDMPGVAHRNSPFGGGGVAGVVDRPGVWNGPADDALRVGVGALKKLSARQASTNSGDSSATKLLAAAVRAAPHSPTRSGPSSPTVQTPSEPGSHPARRRTFGPELGSASTLKSPWGLAVSTYSVAKNCRAHDAAAGGEFFHLPPASQSTDVRP